MTKIRGKRWKKEEKNKINHKYWTQKTEKEQHEAQPKKQNGLEISTVWSTARHSVL